MIIQNRFDGMRGTAKRRILVVVAEMGHNSQREIASISAWARGAGWSIDVVEGRHFGNKPDFARWECRRVKAERQHGRRLEALFCQRLSRFMTPTAISNPPIATRFARYSPAPARPASKRLSQSVAARS